MGVSFHVPLGRWVHAVFLRYILKGTSLAHVAGIGSTWVDDASVVSGAVKTLLAVGSRGLPCSASSEDGQALECQPPRWMWGGHNSSPRFPFSLPWWGRRRSTFLMYFIGILDTFCVVTIHVYCLFFSRVACHFLIDFRVLYMFWKWAIWWICALKIISPALWLPLRLV